MIDRLHKILTNAYCILAGGVLIAALVIGTCK
jgi:hypothetical protein